MSNFTLSVLSTLCLVTKSDLKHHQEELSLTQEEQARFKDTAAALNTVCYTPRPATLQLIFDYANNKQTEKK
ncbi:hypothetical protein FHW36_101179 [Chitinophaga polysaccharea]|uniref:Uncharacterized protein n=2 Tax=Chitinophaga TaxID=79328 RepID=A0A847SMD5_9BACT|nr:MULTISPECIES: hypothetical protein [Chitinophaga]NLR78526.1 hypothetical protein [Chitinophaga eiseniae]TWF44261.1 hypothetical protein FHW36_101179 [Chitinophaga polysaccharea]